MILKQLRDSVEAWEEVATKYGISRNEQKAYGASFEYLINILELN